MTLNKWIMASYRIVYNRKNTLNKEGKALVQIEVYKAARRRYFSTEVEISPEQWNPKKGEVKNDPLSNRKIRFKRQALEEFELMFPKLYGRPFQLSDFDLMDQQDSITNQARLTFTDYFREQLAQDKSGVELGTHQRKQRVYDRLLQYHRRPVEFSDLTYSLIVGFDQSLRNDHGLDIETIRKSHQILKSYIGRALKSGLLPKPINPYEDFRAKRKESDKIILTEQEIRTLEQLVTPKEKQHLQFYLDAWLLAYYTTLRISDLTTLRAKHLTETEKGLQLDKVQEKTKRMLTIPLWNLHRNEQGVSKATIIIQKYWPSNERPLIARSHFQLNKQFKEVLKLARIRKPITFHSARHTGITHLVKKLPIPIVQRIAGHAKIQTTMQYLHLSNMDVEQALEQVNW